MKGENKKMKKIGICTLYFSNNFGAILQAFALQETLLNMGYDVEFIKLKEFPTDKNHINIEKFNDSKKHLKIAKNLYNSELDSYDAIIVGSDEMWNLKNDSFEHLDEYFGYNFNCDKIISYAPSGNGTSPTFFKEFYANKNINFDTFTNISARDLKTKELVNTISGRNAELVLDPTLLIENFEKYAKFPSKDFKDYIIIYGYNFNDDEITKITSFAKKHNKKIYSIGFQKDWCDTLTADIFEFLGYIKNADYVITNTFHGTLFSLILEKEFAIFSKSNNKVEDIMDRLQFQDRDAMEVKDLDKIFEQKVNYEKINTLKSKYREISLNYLKNNLK